MNTLGPSTSLLKLLNMLELSSCQVSGKNASLNVTMMRQWSANLVFHRDVGALNVK